MDTFANLTNLVSVQLDNNALSNLHPNLFHGLVNLRSLRLEVNKITSLPVGLFRSLSKLQVLSLFDNQILSIDPGTLLPMVSLLNLDMDNNQVSNLTKEMILVPKRFSFRKNPFVCRCDLFWLTHVTNLMTKTRLPFCENVTKTHIIDYIDRFCCGSRDETCKPANVLVSTP